MNSQYLDFCESIDETKLKEVSTILTDGGIGIFPTDTVYGIGCNAFLENSILKLFQLKHRTPSKPINVLISDFNMLNNLAIDINESEYLLMKTFWPGPLTIILNKHPNISSHLTANLNTIGVRMPDHPIAQSLIQSAKVPIATTSANISNMPSGTNLSDIFEDFNHKVSFMINGGSSPIGVASTVIRLENNSLHILRKGVISEDSIRKVLERS